MSILFCRVCVALEPARSQTEKSEQPQRNESTSCSVNRLLERRSSSKAQVCAAEMAKNSTESESAQRWTEFLQMLCFIFSPTLLVCTVRTSEAALQPRLEAQSKTLIFIWFFTEIVALSSLQCVTNLFNRSHIKASHRGTGCSVSNWWFC